MNKVLSEMFYPFRAEENLAHNGFRIGKPVKTAPNWTGRVPRDEFWQSLHENPGPKPILFVSDAINPLINTAFWQKCFNKHRIVNAI